MSSPECVAWYHGSFAPPTNAHIQTALLLARKFVMINPGKRCRFCIIPVSNAYKKASVQCIRDEYPTLRRDLCIKFAEIVQQKALEMPELKTSGVEFSLELHDMDSSVDVTPYDSLLHIGSKYELTPSNIFIAQGQDNIDDALKAKMWEFVPQIMEYPVIVAPRNIIESEDGWKEKQRTYALSTSPPYTKIDEYLSRLTFADIRSGEDKYASHSSTFIRELLRRITPDTLPYLTKILNIYIHKDILSIILMASLSKGAELAYTNKSCESTGVINPLVIKQVSNRLKEEHANRRNNRKSRRKYRIHNERRNSRKKRQL